MFRRLEFWSVTLLGKVKLGASEHLGAESGIEMNKLSPHWHVEKVNLGDTKRT